MQTPDVSILSLGLQETVKMAFKLTCDFWNETPRFRDDDPQSSTNLEDISSFAFNVKQVWSSSKNKFAHSV